MNLGVCAAHRVFLGKVADQVRRVLGGLKGRRYRRPRTTQTPCPTSLHTSHTETHLTHHRYYPAVLSICGGLIVPRQDVWNS